jgi:predicted O-methyltransferase YrrM
MPNANLANRRATIERLLLPKSVFRSLEMHREKRALAALQRLSCDVAALRGAQDTRVADWLSENLEAEWQQAERNMLVAGFGSGSGAVNPGDRRALFQFVSALKPRSVLEVGTHVGASTATIALALREGARLAGGVEPRLVTVDILDVNDPERGTWKRIGCSHSPADVMRAIGCRELVTFVTSDSIPYLTSCKERFDLIFLDGNHAATAVYQEIPAALRLLSPGGLILLHDYFPKLEPLWSDGAVVPGPWLGVERLRAEGAPIVVAPLAALPWPTKLGSNVSSLAIVYKAQ